MPNQYVKKVSSLAEIRNLPNAAGVGTYNGGLFVNPDGTPRLIGGFSFGATYFVDGDNGADTNDGKSAGSALKTIQAAVTAASAGDRIFILSLKPDTAGVAAGTAADPPGYGESIIIPATHVNLSLIGIARGVGQMSQPCVRKGTTTTNPLLTVRAVGCLVAGITFNGADATGGGIKLDSDGSTKDAGGLVVSSCHFKNCKGSAAARTGGAIWWSAGGSWYVTIEDCDFVECRGGIVVANTTYSRPVDIKILNCRFASSAKTAIDCDIFLAGAGSGCEEVVIDGCVFATVDVPAYAATPDAARYLDLTGCEGIVSNCSFACLADGTGAKTFKVDGDGAKIPATVRIAHCYGECVSDGTLGGAIERAT